MDETSPERHEQSPRAVDAAKLAELFYFSSERASHVDNDDIDENLGLLSDYLSFRAGQDLDMGYELVTAFESFQDPDPTLAKLETAEAMQEQANRIRDLLGLPPLDLPTELLPGDLRPPDPWEAH